MLSVFLRELQKYKVTKQSYKVTLGSSINGEGGGSGVLISAGVGTLEKIK